jgi:hypothetical protein
MFQFGLFSTSLPYIILASLYILGFGVYSGKSIVEKFLPDNNTSSEISYNPGHSYSSFNNAKSLHFNKIKNEFHKQFKDRPKDTILAKADLDIDISFELILNSYSSFSYTLFSRPPPLV